MESKDKLLKEVFDNFGGLECYHNLETRLLKAILLILFDIKEVLIKTFTVFLLLFVVLIVMLFFTIILITFG